MQNNNGYFEPATANQINLLKRWKEEGKYSGRVDGLTKGEASDIIRAAQENKPNQQPTVFDTQYQQPEQQPSATYQQPSATGQMQQFNKSDLAVVGNLGIQADKLLENLTNLANDGELFIPENYPVGNALKSAVFSIMNSEQSTALLNCSEESKAQALTEYIIQRLDASKKQAYFIPYAGKMTMMRSYFGDALVVKDTGLVSDIYAIVIYSGDQIEIGFDEYGRKTLVKHITKFENQDNEIIGAYAVAVGVNGYKCYEFMTRKELDASWKMSKVPAEKNKFQNNFTQEAAKRTVIRRLVKMIFNTSLNTTQEQRALIGSYNRTTADEYDDDSRIINDEVKNTTTEAVKTEQKQKTASKKVAPESEEWLEGNE